MLSRSDVSRKRLFLGGLIGNVGSVALFLTPDLSTSLAFQNVAIRWLKTTASLEERFSDVLVWMWQELPPEQTTLCGISRDEAGQGCVKTDYNITSMSVSNEILH